MNGDLLSADYNIDVLDQASCDWCGMVIEKAYINGPGKRVRRDRSNRIDCEADIPYKKGQAKLVTYHKDCWLEAVQKGKY